MEIRVEKSGAAALIKLSGRVDISTSPDLRNAALTLYLRGGCKNVTIDFGNVSYIDTSGLATLIEILLSAKRQIAQLTLSGLNAKSCYLLEVNGLLGFFKLEASTREKLSA